MNKYIFIFFTHSGAIKFDRKMKKNKIECNLMPVPRNLSSNCGIGATVLYNNTYKELINDEIEKIFSEEKKLLYESE